MAYPANGTKSTDLFIPQVVADYVEQKYIDNIVFSPLARIYTDLQGRPGDTITFPQFAYIGAAVDVAEGTDIPLKKLTATTTTVKIKKAGNAAQITDEGVFYGSGSPLEELANQFVLSISDKIEDDFVSTMSTGIQAGMTHTASTAVLTTDSIIDAAALFGENLSTGSVLFVSAKQAANLMKSDSWIKATDMGVERLVRGVIGMIGGAQIVISNRIDDSGATVNNYMLKPNSLGLAVKTGTVVESDRDILSASTVMTVWKHYATFLADATKAVKLVVKGYGA